MKRTRRNPLIMWFNAYQTKVGHIYVSCPYKRRVDAEAGAENLRQFGTKCIYRIRAEEKIKVPTFLESLAPNRGGWMNSGRVR